MATVIDRATDILQAYKDPLTGLPDPSFVLQLSDDVYSSSNLFAVQKSFEGDFQFDVFFESSSAKQKLSCKHRFDHRAFSCVLNCTAAVLDQGIPALTTACAARFENTFPIPPSYPTPDHRSLESFSKAITANLVGGVGYFYGTSIVNKQFSYEWDEDTDTSSNEGDDEEKGARLTEPRGLLTATPSRSFFPRGFYWYLSFLIPYRFAVDRAGIGTKAFIYCISENGITISGMSISPNFESMHANVSQSRDFEELDRPYRRERLGCARADPWRRSAQQGRPSFHH